MSMNMGLPYPHLAPAKNVHGMKEKRDKNPQRLSNVQYPSKRKLGSSSVIDFDQAKIFQKGKAMSH